MAMDRARLFVEIEDPLKAHPVIDAHVREVLGSMITPTPTLPLEIEAAVLSAIGNYEEAIPKWKRAYEEAPARVSIAYRYRDALVRAGRDEELVDFLPESPLQNYDKDILSSKSWEKSRSHRLGNGSLEWRKYCLK